MDSSFTPIEQMLKFRASRHEDFPYQEILLTRLCMHMQSTERSPHNFPKT